MPLCAGPGQAAALGRAGVWQQRGRCAVYAALCMLPRSVLHASACSKVSGLLLLRLRWLLRWLHWRCAVSVCHTHAGARVHALEAQQRPLLHCRSAKWSRRHAGHRQSHTLDALCPMHVTHVPLCFSLCAELEVESPACWPPSVTHLSLEHCSLTRLPRSLTRLTQVGLVGAAAGLREAGWVANGVVGRQAHARAMTRIRVRWQPHAHDARGHGHRGSELFQTQAAAGHAKPCLASGAAGQSLAVWLHTLAASAAAQPGAPPAHVCRGAGMTARQHSLLI